ncbi:MAG: translational GTPase TypA [Chthoniobacterales bacterium]|nr:translational GTPase TypA [Chthoniobacterales bacterium]
MRDIRNIAIIAHVDHGKTTLVDQLLRQAGVFRPNQLIEERVLDCMELEREKGITIRAKNASFFWKNCKVNLVDTPGHADFGGEVERTLRMVDGALLVVDAAEGPQAQTKFVLRKALAQGLGIIVVVNKVDRENARPFQTLDRVFELFLELGANDNQLDFPYLFASAKLGFAKRTLNDPAEGMQPLFEAILQHCPPPAVGEISELQILISNLDYNDYLGRVAIGKITSGKLRRGQAVWLVSSANRYQAHVTAIFGYSGLERVELDEASAGDIVGVTGFAEARIGDSLCGTENTPPLPPVSLDPPTISMRISVNDSPLAGKEGKFLTARQIWERLEREMRTNVALQAVETHTPGAFELKARGEMQIAILAEEMRREGFEFLISRPEVILVRNEAQELYEPYETLYLDLPQDFLGETLKLLTRRKAEIIRMDHNAANVYIEATIPTRGLIGFESEFVNLTRGQGISSHLFKKYAPFKGEIPNRITGVLVAVEQGISTSYALESIQERGRLFIGPGEEVYEGMIIGENSRPGDLPVNPCKTKKLTNIRSQGEGKGIQLEPPLKMSLEQCLEFLAEDECLEVTPKNLRLRKKILDANERRRAATKSSSLSTC